MGRRQRSDGTGYWSSSVDHSGIGTTTVISSQCLSIDNCSFEVYTGEPIAVKRT